VGLCAGLSTMGVVQLLGLAVIVHGLPAAVHKGDAAPTAMQTDCLAISINVNDYWCQTMCPTGQCPEDMCKCGAEAAALKASPAPGTPAGESASFAARDLSDDLGGVPLVIVGEDDACKSLSDSASDEWCTSTCKDNKANCPTMCECSDDNMEVVKEDPLEAAQKAADKAAKDAANGIATPVAGAAPAPVAATPATVAGDFSKCKSLTLAATDEWCVHSCETGNCPETICNCDGKVPKEVPVATAASAPAAVPAVPAPAVPAVPAQPVAAEPVAAPAAVPAPAVPAVPQVTAPVAAPVPEVSPVAAPVQAPAPVAEPAAAVPAVPAAPAAPVVATASNCKAVSNAATDDWCALTCGAGTAACPETLCKCDAAESPSPSK
jgi:hypothetical protein